MTIGKLKDGTWWWSCSKCGRPREAMDSKEQAESVEALHNLMHDLTGTD